LPNAVLRNAEAHFNLGLALHQQGRLNEAVSQYREALVLIPDHADARCNLGTALKDTGRLVEAVACYEAVLSREPRHVGALYNLAVATTLLNDVQKAEACYALVIELAPDTVMAYLNLSVILADQKRHDEAHKLRDIAYRKQSLFVPPLNPRLRTVMVLLENGRGNVPFRLFMPTQENNLVEWLIEYAAPNQPLPPYDVVFNAIGDPDSKTAGNASLIQFAKTCAKPFLNPPEKVLRTARFNMPELLKGIEHIVVPPVWRVKQADKWFDNPDFKFPVLVRPLSSQGGEGLMRILTREELANLPHDPTGDVHLCNYHDYQSPDGYFRKYRMIFVDRAPYPYHLAISPNWMVHYHSADMPAHTWKLEEEIRFLEDPESALGEKGLEAIRKLGRRLDLDYAGVDFTIMPDGTLLIFEANATMRVHTEDAGPLAPKNPYIQNIIDAFRSMLIKMCRK
jgi:tetratricopeptide (TPR) repeat protein